MTFVAGVDPELLKLWRESSALCASGKFSPGPPSGAVGSKEDCAQRVGKVCGRSDVVCNGDYTQFVDPTRRIVYATGYDPTGGLLSP
jgi:hypothetical protein